MSFNLLHYRSAAFASIAVETCEEERFLRNVLSIPDAAVYLVSALPGMRDARSGDMIDAQAQYAKAFKFCAANPGSILLAYDYQHIVKNPGAYRALKDCFPALKDAGSMVVLVSPSWSLPAELSHDIPILQFDLPTRSQLRRALDVVAQGADITVSDPEPILDSAAGLSLQEAENAMALALVEKKVLDPATVEREKMRLVKSSGYLEVSAVASPDSVGGLGNLKAYIANEVIPSKGDDFLRVRGVLLVGVPGTGKSLASRAFGAMLGWPVLRMDVGTLKGSLVGQSESNMRQALKLADAVAPCVLWLDEIEKGVGGHASSAQSDGGTTLGMIGQLLGWLQDHSSAVVVVATCNDYSKLPAELTRAGRFDERFFVDLPSASEREEIAIVHLRKYTGDNEALSVQVAGLTVDWTGAEIEQLVKSAARRTNRAITLESLQAASREIKPISKVKADEISHLREWAKDTLRIANTPEIKAAQVRKVVVNG
jgi:hypothetical protein